MDLERLPAELRRCDGPRLQTADVLDDHTRALVPVDGRIIARERTGIRRLTMILRRARCGACSDVTQRAHKQVRAHDGQTVKEFSCRLKLADRRLRGIDHVSGVHFAIKVHGRNAGHGIAVEHRPLDGRGAAVLRQQRAMDIDRPIGRRCEQIIRQNAAIGHNDENIRLQALEICQRRAVAHLCRLKHRSPAVSAISLTGLGWSFIPRFFGLSGCVNTPTTSNRSSSRRCRDTAAKSGVPINTMRMRLTPSSAAQSPRGRASGWPCR